MSTRLTNHPIPGKLYCIGCQPGHDNPIALRDLKAAREGHECPGTSYVKLHTPILVVACGRDVDGRRIVLVASDKGLGWIHGDACNTITFWSCTP